MNKNTGGPVFPAPFLKVRQDLPVEYVEIIGQLQGMTLRDYFAGQALMGHISREGLEGSAGDDNNSAIMCYEHADAMIEARSY